jgi:hypothetical protein
VEDNYVILECLNNHLTPFSFLQYNLEDQIKLFGFIIILSYISPVGLGFVLYIVKIKINLKYLLFFFLL